MPGMLLFGMIGALLLAADLDAGRAAAESQTRSLAFP